MNSTYSAVIFWICFEDLFLLCLDYKRDLDGRKGKNLLAYKKTEFVKKNCLESLILEEEENTGQVHL